MAAALLALTVVQDVYADDRLNVSYNQDIRPLLSDFCYKCHGPDQQRRQGELRLDKKQSAFGRTESGKRAIVSGDLQRSEVWRRINSDDDEYRMPPKSFGKSLSATQKRKFKTWILAGAPWGRHWAYVTPIRPSLPTVKQTAWPSTSIDAFTLAAMEARGLRPSVQADKFQLLRRVTFDLTGLPPTPNDISRFLADRRPGAYERAVDRLLASPRYGERMALYWLDLARYADTHGFHTDSHRDMWRWRDWVIDAFNSNKPFDQFTIEQLAGDLLPSPSLDQLIATGFNRNNMINFEAGALPEEYHTEYVIDRVVTTATVWMAQTFQCARCHDHKYDDISQRDFYRLYDYFNQVPEEGLGGEKGNAAPFIDAPTRQQMRRQEILKSQLAQIDASLARRAAACDRDLARWEHKLKTGAVKIRRPPADPLAYYRFENQEAPAQDETKAAHHGKVQGTAILVPDKFNNALLFTGDISVEVEQLAAIKRSQPLSVSAWVMPTSNSTMTVFSRYDEKIKRGYDWRIDQGRLLFELRHNDAQALLVQAEVALKQNEWQHIAVTYDGSAKSLGVRLILNGQRLNAKVISDTLKDSIQVAATTTIGGRKTFRPFRGMMDEVRVYSRQLRSEEVANLSTGLPVAAILATPSARRTKKQRAELKQYFLRQVDAAALALRHRRNDIENREQELRGDIVTTMVMKDGNERRQTFVLRRGNYQQPVQSVTAGLPAALPRWGQYEPNRLGLARWLTDPRHPLTARVMVNRWWQMFYGQGLVRTPGDFGVRGQPPTHPKLLDWLAVEFVESGWDVKHMVRLMVLSNTYRQSSRIRHSDAPDNRWLTRSARIRLPAEFIRDAALSASGLLDHRLGGRSVHPYQPRGLWKDVSFHPHDYSAQIYSRSNGADLYRRSMYTFWKRAVPPPSLVVFDAPDRETCTVQRTKSNSPLQALVLMNDPTYVEAARVLAERLVAIHKKDGEAIIRSAYLRCLGRTPNSQEVKLLQTIYQEQLREYRAKPHLAEALLLLGESPGATGRRAPTVAAWATTLGVIMSTDEMITRP